MGKKRTITEKTVYLSHRPFLIIDLIHKPSASARTHIKGWMDRPNAVESHENPYLVDRVAARHLRQATVIIDLMNKKMVKNRFKDTPAQEVYDHYTRKYGGHIAQALSIWRARNGIADPVVEAEPAPLTVTMASTTPP